jgi:hypothetical protein
MTIPTPPQPNDEWSFLDRLREFQEQFGGPVRDIDTESPGEALISLRDAAQRAPASYSDYLDEALACYEGEQFRAAVLMVWAATVAHLHDVISASPQRIKKLEAANKSRYGNSKNYRKITKQGDLLYLTEAQLVQLGEDAGAYNRNARSILQDSLDLRNKCAHPTGFVPGRGEVVIFVERLLVNIVGGAMISW